MNALDLIKSNATATHHCAGKLDGVVAYLADETAVGNINGTHSIYIVHGDKITALPIAPEAAARSAFARMVADLNEAAR